MYKYTIYKKKQNIGYIFANSYKRALVLANTVYPEQNIPIKEYKRHNPDICLVCKEIKNNKLQCSCWGYS
jgi:hypothetical protein